MSNSKVWVGVIAFVVVMALVVISNLNTMQSTLGTGLSISQIDYQSNDPDLSGKAWSMVVVQDGSAGYAYGSFKATDLVDSADNIQAEKPFALSLSLLENKAIYDITKINSNLYSYSTTYRRAGLFSKQCAELTPPGGAMFYASINLPGTLDNLCVWRTTDGVFGKVDKNKLTFITRIDVTVDGKTKYSGALSSNEVSTSIGSLGRAKWVGSLSNLLFLPQPSDRDICAFFGNSWITSSCQDKTAWELKDATVLSCLANSETYRGRSGSSYTFESETLSYANRNCMNTLQQLNNNIRAGKLFQLQGGNGAEQVSTTSSGGIIGTTSGTSSGGKIVFDLGTNIFHYPLIRIDLSADKVYGLGFYEPVGQPDISCTGSNKVDSGTYGSVDVKVKNSGSAVASFDVTAVCKSPFNSQDTRRVSGLAPGQSSTISLLVTADLNNDASGSCTVTAVDVNKASAKDSCSQSIKGTATIIKCNSGDKRAVGNLIQQCKDNTWTTIKNCADEGKIADAAKLECVASGSSSSIGGGSACSPLWSVNFNNEQRTIIPNFSFKCLGFWSSIRLLTGFVGTLMAFLLVFAVSDKTLGERNKLVTFIFSILGATLAFAFVMTFWWITVIIVVLYVILKSVIGSVNPIKK